jgi:formyl-CoA transferase/CoA:oxalate CoA-transferase
LALKFHPDKDGTSPTSRNTLPLTGLRILDLTRILSGPFCTMKLGDMGAEVIKIEQPVTGDETRRWGPPFVHGESAYFLSVNRNKKSVTLDLKSKQGKRILAGLIGRSDVVVENFRAGVMEKLGFSYRNMRRINPGIIYCSISGYGQTSSRSHKPSYDLIVQGESGLMDVTGIPEGPPTKAGISLADVNAGNIAFEGILLSLLRRSRTGKGERVDISLLDGLISLFAYQSQIALSSKNRVTRRGNRHPTITPYETYSTKDGYINVAVGSDAAWTNFCAAINRPDLASHQYFHTNAQRVKKREALERIILRIMKRRRSAEWLRLFDRADVPAGRINTVQQALSLTTMKERGMIIELNHRKAGRIRAVGTPIRLSGLGSASKLPPPLLGEHTDEIIRKLGYSSNEIRRLRQEKVV